MVKQKRKVTSSKAPQKTVLPVYNKFLHSESDSREDTPRSSVADNENESNPPDSTDQDGNNDSSSEQSNTTSSSGGFGRIPIRSRRRFTPDETEALEKAYNKGKRPTQEVKQRFARDFDTTVPRIQIWFQNRRAKEKKMSDSSTNPKGPTADQDSDSNSTPTSGTVDHEPQTTSSTRRRKIPRKNDSSPPVDNHSTGKRKKQKQKQNQFSNPASQQFLPSGSYHFAYPNYAHQFQAIDHSNTPNTHMNNESLMYAPVYPPRRVYLHDIDWQSQHFMHPSYPQQFQRPLPNERPAKYVDPKNVVRPESSIMAADNISGDKSFSKEGKQRQKSTDTCNTSNADSDAYHSSSPDVKTEQGDLQFFINP